MRDYQTIINEILASRGIVSDEDISEYLSDKPKATYDPFLLADMKEGVDLLVSEIDAGGTICVYGDYDADGVTSVTIMMQALSYLTDKLFYYIPTRFGEGYGINIEAIDKIKEQGASLIISVDCGTVSYEEVEYAKEQGLKVIVTDHHSLGDKLADCILINSKREDNEYPFKDLAGCGVAFKFIQALQRTCNLPKSILTEALDMVAIGTIGDIVPLKDENRTIVKYGLKVIEGRHREPLRRLLEGVDLKNINSVNTAYVIVPHINAAGRIGHAGEAAKLFLSKAESDMDAQVGKLISFNKTRKSQQEDAFKMCQKSIDGSENFILLHAEGINEGIAGIVAGKIKEQYNRPTILVTSNEDGTVKGTGRSVEAVDLYETLKKHKEYFIKFGGHKGACGFSMKQELVDELRAALNNDIDESLRDNPDLFENEVKYDIIIDPGEISIELARALQQMEPFGEGNPSPKFKLSDVNLYRASYMGDAQTHARFQIMGAYVNCVMFGKAQKYADLIFGDDKVDLVGSVDLSRWQGKERVQFKVEEIIKCN